MFDGTAGWLAAGYGAAGALIAGYALSLWIRHRSVRRPDDAGRRGSPSS